MDRHTDRHTDGQTHRQTQLKLLPTTYADGNQSGVIDPAAPCSTSHTGSSFTCLTPSSAPLVAIASLYYAYGYSCQQHCSRLGSKLNKISFLSERYLFLVLFICLQFNCLSFPSKLLSKHCKTFILKTVTNLPVYNCIIET